MNKAEFTAVLRQALADLPSADAEERINFYSEMIDDRMEEGLSEEDAVEKIGDIDTLVEQIKAEIPPAKLTKEKVVIKRKRSALEIVLLILGSPLWISLLLAAGAVCFCLYVVIWTVIICFWAVFASLVACALAALITVAVFVIDGDAAFALAMFGVALVLAGISIFAFLGCKFASKGAAWLTRKISIGIKRCIVGKGRA